METKSAVKLAKIAGKLDALAAFISDDKVSLFLLESAEGIFSVIRDDAPYSLSEGDI